MSHRLIAGLLLPLLAACASDVGRADGFRRFEDGTPDAGMPPDPTPDASPTASSAPDGGMPDASPTPPEDRPPVDGADAVNRGVDKAAVTRAVGDVVGHYRSFLDLRARICPSMEVWFHGYDVPFASGKAADLWDPIDWLPVGPWLDPALHFPQEPHGATMPPFAARRQCRPILQNTGPWTAKPLIRYVGPHFASYRVRASTGKGEARWSERD